MMTQISKREVTIYDIAERLNVSPATVSRCLNSPDEKVSKTKTKVLAMAKEMGYSANANASTLRRRKSRVIGVIVPRFNSSFIADVIAGIEIIVNKANYSLIVSQSLEDIQNEIKCAAVMSSNRVTGLLVSLSYNTTSINHFRDLIHKGTPVIFFDRIFQQEEIQGVFIDNFQAGYRVTAHLVAQGCRNIMHISASREGNVYLERYKGYRQALEDGGLAFEEKMFLTNNLSAAGGVMVAKSILQMDTRPDGIFFANDTCVVNCMMELKKHGIKIPEDIAIVGFNNDPVTLLAEPNLTTVNYNGFDMGEVAAKLLIDHIDHKNSWKSVESLVLKSEVIVRGSSCKLK